jgi:hypothetical protein
MPEGGPEENEVEVSLSVSGGALEVSVRDTGVGMSAEEQKQVFNPFFTTKHGSGGTGLGLAICHRIVSEHQGEITVSSRPGEGATFVVRLTAMEGASVSPAAPSAPEVESPRRGRVLVVDDELLVARSIARALRDHDVSIALDAAEALRLIERGPAFDVILCDLMMPGVSGLDLYEQLETR